ncbi:hypothetical protein HanIR_Chr11g0518661 [Helianthus annuus]|nr:hypothetical protein HanIR_Chr11g0518661 [Helianthus annuus]
MSSRWSSKSTTSFHFSDEIKSNKTMLADGSLMVNLFGPFDSTCFQLLDESRV